MTRLEAIKAYIDGMSAEEMAKRYFNDFADISTDVFKDYKGYCKQSTVCTGHDCESCRAEWLNEEVPEGACK